MLQSSTPAYRNPRASLVSLSVVARFVLSVSALLICSPWGWADQIIGPVNNDGLTSFQLTSTSYVQGVRPLVEQRGTGVDGSYTAPPLAAEGGIASPLPPGGGDGGPEFNPFPPHSGGGGGSCGGGGGPVIGWQGLKSLPGGTQGGGNPGGIQPSGIAGRVVPLMTLPSEGLPWSWSLSYNPRQKTSGGSYFFNSGLTGYGWFNNAQMEIRMFTGASNDKDVMYLFYGADRYAEFKRKTHSSTSDFIGSNGSAGAFAKTAASGGEPEKYTFTDLVGNQFVFFGFDSNAGVAKGQLWKMIGPDGTVAFVGDATTGSTAISSGFDGSGRIIKAYDGADRRYTLTYTSGRLTQILAETKTGGSWASPSGVATVGTVDMTYYGTESYGTAGDLKLITTTTPLSTSGTNSVAKTYFRYWSGTFNSSTNPGTDHDIKYVYQAEGLRQYDWAGDSTLDDDFLTETENNLKPYASSFYKYDSDHRIVETWSNGGCGCSGASTGTYVYRYESNGSYTDNSGYDTAWKSRIVVKEPDKTDGGTTNRWTTFYVDEAGQGLSRVVTDDDPASASNFWMTAVTRSSDGLVTEVDTPAAVATYTNSTGAFTKQSAAGLITTYTRISSTDTKGFPQHVKYQTGSGGTAYLSRSYYYDTSSLTLTDAVVTRPALKSSTVYTTQTSTGDTGPGNSPPGGAYRTEMTNSFRASGDALKLEGAVRTAPAVTTGNNGANSSTTAQTHYGLNGRPDFQKSADGIITYTEYTNGQVSKVIQDADTTLTAGGQDFNGISIPSGYSCSSCGSAFHMRTLMTYDAQGRPANRSSYNSRSTSVIHDAQTPYITKLADGRLVSLGYARVVAGSPTKYYGPVSFSVTNFAGKTESQGVIKLDDNSGEYTTKSQTDHIDETKSDILLGVNWHATNRIGTVARLSTNIYDELGSQLDESRAYFLIPASGAGSAGTNYDATTYAYDNNGHRWRTEEPNGTVHRTVFDTLGRTVSQWVGTNDNDAAFPGGDVGGSSDMVKVSSTVYDAGGDQANNLVTTSTQYIQDSTTGQRITTYDYDVRGRMILQTNPTAPHTLNKYDDAGHLIATGQYSSASGLSSASDPTSVSTNRLALTETTYDELGRQFRTVMHKITQSSGADADNLTTDARWYDAPGRVVKTTGSNLSKTIYDRLGRATRQFTLATTDDAAYSDADDVSGDTVMSENITTYDPDNGLVLMTATIDRFHDDVSGGATTGDLDTNADADDLKFTAANVKGRIQISSNWYDSIDRMVDTVHYGTYGAADFDRDGLSVPSRSDTALRSTYAFNADGTTLSVTDPMNLQTRYVYDDLGRQTAVINNYVNGTPSGTTGDDDVYTRFTYASGLKTEMWVDLDGDAVQDSDDQVTTYTYGVTKGASAGDSLIGSGSLLYRVTYPPQSGGQSAADRRVTNAYNAQGQPIWQSDAEANVKEMVYDDSGRNTQQRLTTLGGSFDATILRVARTYDGLGRPVLVTAYDNATVGSGSVVNEVKYTYSDWGPISNYEQDNDSAVGAGGSPNDYEVAYTFAKATTSRAAIQRSTEALVYASSTLATATYAYVHSAASNDGNLSRMTSVTVGGTQLALYHYNGVGTVVGIEDAQPAIFNRRYTGGGSGSYPDLDIFNRVTSDTWWKDLSTDLAFFDTDWGYDRNGNPTHSEDLIFTPSITAGFDVQYTMDGMNRLTKAEEGDWNGSSISSRSRQQIWTLTETGNWDYDKLDLNGDNDFVDASEHNDHRTHNQPNEITKRDTDNDGNDDLTPVYNKLGELTADNLNYKYVYDGWGRVKKITDNRPSPNLVQEFWYDGLGHRISWKYDTDADSDVDSNDKKYHFAYDERWRIVATYRESDTTPKEEFWHHAAGMDGYGGSSYIDSVILRDKDANSGWTSAADGTLERRDYYVQNWRSDVVALITSGGSMVERVKYSAYGVPYGIPNGDTNGDGTVNGTDQTNVTNWWGSPATKPTGDYDLDGDIDINDLLNVTSTQWGVTEGRGVLSQGGATGVVSSRKGYAGYEFDAVAIDSQWDVRHRRLGSELGRWMSRDDLQNENGLNLYWYTMCSPVSGSDPSGEITVIPGARHLDPLACGQQAFAQWTYRLDKRATCDGYIVQQVDVYCRESSCPCTCGGGMTSVPSFTYWEAFHVLKGQQVWVDEAQRHYTDLAWGTATENLCENYTQVGTIKFYCQDSSFSILGPWGTGNLSQLWSTNGSYGVGDCATSSGYLPSTGSKPLWWDLPAIEGPAERSFGMDWQCCHNWARTAEAYASP